MTFDRRRSELEARSLRRLDLPRVYHENQIAELDAHNSTMVQEFPIGRRSNQLDTFCLASIMFAKPLGQNLSKANFKTRS